MGTAWEMMFGKSIGRSIGIYTHIYIYIPIDIGNGRYETV
jgi:hypothetical protein